jgi:fatty acyl-CoA reductase
MLQLRSFVHVSTYFVNNHMPRNSVVKEQIHPIPLELAGRPVEYKEFVEGLMAMSSEDANKAALELMAKHDFNSTYAFGKHLTERMVVDTQVRPGVQRAIVRPSLIAALLGDPYPG